MNLDALQTDDQRMIADSAKRFAERHGGPARLRTIHNAREGYDTDALRAAADAGWVALLAPESWLDATAVCEVITGNVVCTRMCDDKNSCECPAAYCKRHADRVFDCQNCGGAVCESCCSNFGDGVCDECFLELSGIVPFGVL